ncbi:MAG: bifunctional folylpolyglutamate synthase/dihydrofolate synthase [Magnetococcales bacterium]|nr:bifunctional folylpolyglutamate synthase/dihydrofolate synthase [Magnetococcales bacterium]
MPNPHPDTIQEADTIEHRLDALLKQTEALSDQPMVFGLERTEHLLARLDNPHHGLNIVHVAGTNGKGSVIAFMTAMLIQAGMTVYSHTSPHLNHITERYRINGKPVTSSQLHNLLEEILAINAGESITSFELMTVVALVLFARLTKPKSHSPSIILLETGLGGRLDATNVVTPLLSVITAISLDHTDFLGNTLSAIAAEKAGIIKKGRPVVAAPAHDEASSIIQAYANNQGASLWLAGRDFHFDQTKNGWRYQDQIGQISLPNPALTGQHQFDNAALAIAAVRKLIQLGLIPDQSDCYQAISKAQWPGRLEQISTTPAIWLDGAHNPAAAQALATAWTQLNHTPTLMIFSALADKEIDRMVEILAPLADQVIITPLSSPRAATIQTLKEAWERQQIKTITTQHPEQAVEQARKLVNKEDSILVCGSLDLVGVVRKFIA